MVGRIGKVSIEKLPYYAARLGLKSTIEMRPTVRVRAVRKSSMSHGRDTGHSLQS
jgi:hypothetical protein